jgi:hypothetical protein
MVEIINTTVPGSDCKLRHHGHIVEFLIDCSAQLLQIALSYETFDIALPNIELAVFGKCDSPGDYRISTPINSLFVTPLTRILFGSRLRL